MNAVGIHTFAGLMTEGVKRVFDVPLVINDGYGDKTHLLNHDCELVSSDTDTAFKCDFIFGQPPCAPFSALGVHKQMDDDRMEMSNQAMRITLARQPKVFALESVDLAFTQGFDYYNAWGNEFRALGYNITHLRVDGCSTGSPQRRQRYYFVAHNGPLYVPQLTTAQLARDVLAAASPDDRSLFNDGYIAVQTIRRFPDNPPRPGEGLKPWYDRVHGDDYPRNEKGQRKGRASVASRALDPDDVLYAFTAPTLHWHWDQRPVTFNEQLAWCGLREDYKFSLSGVDHMSRFVARSVMPGTAEWIARMAEGTINGQGASTSDVVTIRDGAITQSVL